MKSERQISREIIINCIGGENLKEIVSLLQTNKYSIFIHESTDISTTKQFQLVSNLFEAHDIPFSNMPGFTADNASVMMDSIEGLKAKLFEKVPHLIVIGCICYSLNLHSSAACQKLPKSIEELCRDIQVSRICEC